MRMRAARLALVDYGTRLVRDGLAVGSSGNLSVRSGTMIAVTPTGMPCDELLGDDVCVVAATGELLECTRRPTSELPLHLAVYAATGCGAIVHTHSPYATVLATAERALPPIHYLAADLGGEVRVAPYETFGTQALGDAAVEALAGRTAVLLERHGTLTIGDTLAQAYDRAVNLEWLAALYLRVSTITRLAPLGDAELERVRERLARRGRPERPRTATGAAARPMSLLREDP